MPRQSLFRKTVENLQLAPQSLRPPDKPRLTVFQYPSLLRVRCHTLRRRPALRRYVIVGEHQPDLAHFRLAVDLLDLNVSVPDGLHPATVLLERNQFTRPRAEIRISRILVALDQRCPASVRSLLYRCCLDFR